MPVRPVRRRRFVSAWTTGGRGNRIRDTRIDAAVALSVPTSPGIAHMNVLPRHCWPAGVRCAVALVVMFYGASAAQGAEDCGEFLEALRDRGYYDVALEYLGQLRGNPKVAAEFKQRIPYEEGVTSIAAAIAERDADQKSRHLNAAREKLNEFIKAQSDPSLTAEAESQLGNVLVERAKMLLQREICRAMRRRSRPSPRKRAACSLNPRRCSPRPSRSSPNTTKTCPSRARKAMAQADVRQEARMDLRRARLFAAQAIYESSKAYPADSPERKKLLESAATKFGDLREKYRTILLGLMATTSQGRCYLDLGDMKRALGAFTEILSQQDEPEELRRLKATRCTWPCRPGPATRKKVTRQRRKRGPNGSPGRPAATTRARAIGWRFAISRPSRCTSTPIRLARRITRRRSKSYATHKQAKEAAALPGEYQEQAKQLFQELAGSADAEDKAPANFAEAYELAKESLDQMQAKLAQIKLAPSVNDQANVPTYEKESQEARDKARAVPLGAGSARPLDAAGRRQ